MKKIVLLISFLGSFLVLLRGNSVNLQLCEMADTTCRFFYSNVWKISLIFPIILIFSLITYFLPNQAFKAWLKFSIIWVPVVLISTAIVRFMYTGSGGFFDTPDFIILPITIFTYTIYILGSIISIIRGYNKKPN